MLALSAVPVAGDQLAKPPSVQEAEEQAHHHVMSEEMAEARLRWTDLWSSGEDSRCH